MSDGDWILEIVLRGPHGERYGIAEPIGIVRDVMVTKPRDLGMPWSGLTMDDVVEVVRRREFRKKRFEHACTRMGVMLAERLEDKEGWHGDGRAENLKEWGS